MSLHTGQLPSPKLTNKSPLKLDFSKRKLVFQPSISRCTLLVSGRVYNKYIPTSVNTFFLLKPFFVKNHQQISTAPSPGSDVIWGCQNDTQRTESDGCFGSWKSTELPFTVQFSLERKASTYRELYRSKLSKNVKKQFQPKGEKRKKVNSKRQEKNKNTNDSAFNPLSQPRRHVVPTKCIWWSTHFSSHGNGVASRTHYVRLTLVWGISATEPDSEKMKIWSHHKNWSWFQAFNLFFLQPENWGSDPIWSS